MVDNAANYRAIIYKTIRHNNWVILLYQRQGLRSMKKSTKAQERAQKREGNNLEHVTSWKRKFLMSHWKVIAFYLAVFDVIAVNASYFLALWLRFDARYSNIPQEYLHAFLQFAPFYTIFTLLVFLGLRLYPLSRRLSLTKSSLVRPIIAATVEAPPLHRNQSNDL